MVSVSTSPSKLDWFNQSSPERGIEIELHSCSTAPGGRDCEPVALARSLPQREGEQQTNRKKHQRERPVDDAVLQPRASGGTRIRHAREGDHGVKREVNAGQRRFQPMVELLFRSESFRRGLVAHLDEIRDGEIGERVRVFFPALEIFGEGALAIVRECGQAFVQDNAIFERGVHALSVKWNNRVGRIADERDRVFEGPGRATDRDQRSGRVFPEIFEERRHERDGVGKFFSEETADLVVGRRRFETARALEFPKERAGE
jgi:hypothetical protein